MSKQIQRQSQEQIQESNKLSNRLFSLCKSIEVVKKELNTLSKKKKNKKTSDQTTIIEGKNWLVNKSYYPTVEQENQEMKKYMLDNIKRQNALLELLDSLNCEYCNAANKYLLLNQNK